ncbi:hypothetical protein GKC29_17525 [Micromonospora sp. WMMC415]|uniref:hypothetical protein n=1 Tax=Micromonospora sp. WMMC415 TaxID=2675222 RepID=UPI0012B44B5B|nr:hypothetical protein [Micromonospora sp. WMMC415]QGN48462.1 hypothetical protein GKC29_17525 [Micromonospora sp. WMMC415]
MREATMDAARDNAAWCDLVCRTHGLTGVTDADAWSVPRRSPTWYPDAVTLRPGVDAATLLGRIDAGPGASVKDSFADLDLARFGFRVLFDAHWIHRPAAAVHRPPAAPTAGAASAPRVPAARPGSPLTRVTTPGGLAGWAEAHGGGPLFRPALLGDPRVTVLARVDAGVVAGGAVLHHGGRAVGVSNVFARAVPPEEVWAGLPGSAALVGYEPGDDLAVARSVGFRPAGPLRVWLRD